jgi:hypothetical protein
VLSSITKKGEIVRKMDPGHLANWVLVFDEQRNPWTNKLSSVCVCSSQDAMRIGPRQWGCNTSNEDIKRCIEVQDSRTKEARRNQQRDPRKGLSASAWWRTGQCTVPVRCAPDCPVGQPDGLRREAAGRRSRAVAPDCPVCQRAEGNGRIQRSTATGANGRLTWAHRTSTVQCPVVHRTVRCTRRQKAAAFCPTASLGCGGYKYHPNRPFSSVGAQAIYQGIL